MAVQGVEPKINTLVDLSVAVWYTGLPYVLYVLKKFWRLEG